MSQAIQDANTVERFLQEPIISGTLARLHQDAYREFLLAQTDEDRRAAHSYAKAVDRLETAFRAVVDAGSRERMDEQTADRRLATR